MSDRKLNFAALEECLQTLQHLFIDISRLDVETGYKAKRGGYGDVQVSRLDPRTPNSKLVAAKRVSLRARDEDPQRLPFRLARELKVWAGLHHPHILPLFGYYLDEGYKTAILISEYMIYGDLKDYIDQTRPSWASRLNLARDLTDGLVYLHGQEPPVIHGDLKPGNVLVNAEQRAVLADFGLSKALEELPTGLTTSSDLKGSFRYYSPELLREEKPEKTSSSDIWAWACLVLEVLTDKVPYAQKVHEHHVFAALVTNELPSDAETLPIPAPAIKYLLARCWSIQPNERPLAKDCLHILNSENLDTEFNDVTDGSGLQFLTTRPSSQPGFQSPRGARQGAQSSTSGGALRSGDRERLLSIAGSDNDADEEEMGTMRPGATRVSFSQAAIPAVFTAKAKRMSLRSAHAKSIQRGPSQSNAGEDTQLNGAEGEEEYYSDSDSSEDDERFWNASSAPSATATPPVIKTSGPDGKGSSTLGPSNRGRGPTLTLTIISPLVDDRGSPVLTPLTAAPSPSPVDALSPTGGIDRRASFRRDTWAFRPIQADVLDHLQDFFPDHDLDKPFIDQVQFANEGLSSPGGEALPPPAPAPVSKEARFKHRKSIRVVAEERKKVLERVGSARQPSAEAANLGRKKSTKLWGIRVEEVTPGQVKRGVPPTIPESPTGPAPRPTIKWVKGELIGEGTYGKVFLAFNVTTGEMMALKQVEMPQTISDQDDVRQVNIVKALESEQQTLEKLDHPNIVQYLGFEKTKEFFSVFLEYVPGGSIGSCLRRHGKFEENIIKSFTGQIIDGLAYLHANKIIHRDIKADNVLVDPSGYCKISDFGTSKQTEEIYNNVAMTAMRGSLFWMAPEMLNHGERGYNAKIDIWSLGCVFIEMFAGRRPWEQDNLVSIMFKVGYNKMAPPAPSDVHLSPEAENFRLKCFTQDQNERPTAEGLKGHPWLDLPPGWIFSGFHWNSLV